MPVAAYRRLVSRSGWSYVVVAFLGRLPIAMSQIGVLLLVAQSSGSYGAGGACAGALAIANALGSPWFGHLADRHGQRNVVLLQSLAAAAFLVLVVVIAWSSLGWHWVLPIAALAGFFSPQVGPLARVRWRPITQGEPHQERLVSAAFSYEGAADETSFVLGPALVGLLIFLVSPGFALLVAAALLAVFGCGFALHHSASLLGRSHAEEVPLGRLVTPVLLLLSIAQLVVGMVFGSVQTGTSVLATAAGQVGLTGLLHSLLGVGSAIVGLLVAGLPERFSLANRLVVSALALLVLGLPLLLVDSLAALAVVLLVLGCAIAPYMITNFTIAERVTSNDRVGAAMTLLAAATGLGYALGAAVAGRLADWGGHTPAFAVTVVAGMLACLVAGVLRSALARRQSA